MKLFQVVLNIATGIFWGVPIADVLALAATAAVMVRLWKRLKAADGGAAAGQAAPGWLTSTIKVG